MRKISLTADSVKARIASLKGSKVRLLVNRGRKRIVKMTGTVVEVYPSLFSVKVDDSKSLDILSFSFSDVLCGDVRVLPEIENETSDGKALRKQ